MKVRERHIQATRARAGAAPLQEARSGSFAGGWKRLRCTALEARTPASPDSDWKRLQLRCFPCLDWRYACAGQAPDWPRAGTTHVSVIDRSNSSPPLPASRHAGTHGVMHASAQAARGRGRKRSSPEYSVLEQLEISLGLQFEAQPGRHGRDVPSCRVGNGAGERGWGRRVVRVGRVGRVGQDDVRGSVQEM